MHSLLDSASLHEWLTHNTELGKVLKCYLM